MHQPWTTHLKQSHVMCTFLSGCNPKFNCIFLWFPLVYDCCGSYARDLHSPVHACASDSCFYWSKSVSVLQKEIRRDKSQPHMLGFPITEGILMCDFWAPLKLETAISVYESMYLPLTMTLFCFTHEISWFAICERSVIFLVRENIRDQIMIPSNVNHKHS